MIPFLPKFAAAARITRVAALLLSLSSAVPMLVRAAEPVLIAAGNDASEGMALAAELRTARPNQSFTNAAVLHRRGADGRRTQIPIRIQTLVPQTGDDWTVVYRAEPSGALGGQTLTLHHRPGSTPTREVLRDGAAAAVTAGPEESFAGSDFSVSDLALEFLHWPGQKIIRRDRPEMRKGRPCRILESTRPAASTSNGGPVRVKSWIDLEHKQPLMAEAYDARGTLIKAFSVGSVKKVDGVWKLKDLEIVDEQAGTLTRLEFDWTVQ